MSLELFSATLAITTKDAANGCAESDEECDEGTEGHPVGVSVLSGVALVSELVAEDAKEDHVNDPDDESEHSSNGSGDCHEDGTSAVVSRAADTEERCQKSESSGDWVQDKDISKIVYDGAVEQTALGVELVDSVAKVSAAASKAKYAKVGFPTANVGVEEANLVPDWRGERHDEEEDEGSEAEEEAWSSGRCHCWVVVVSRLAGREGSRCRR